MEVSNTDNAALASRILLMRANNRTKVRAWMGSAPDDELEHQQSQHDADDTRRLDQIDDFKGDNENSGIGVKTSVQDDPLNRQLSSANDALRRKLLSKDALKRYQQNNRSTMSASKPMPKQHNKVATGGSDDEDTGKGKGAGRLNRAKTTAINEKTSLSASASKKRPASYLDQLLAERGKKKSKARDKD